MTDERIPMMEKGGEDEKNDDDEEQETSFGGGNEMEGSIARERGARPKTKTKTKTSSFVNPSYEGDKNEDIDVIISKMLIGKDLTVEEEQRLKRLEEEEGIKIKTTTYEDNSIRAGGYDGSIMISNKEGEKFYFFGVAKNKSINEFKRIYPNMDKGNLEKLEFGTDERKWNARSKNKKNKWNTLQYRLRRNQNR